MHVAEADSDKKVRLFAVAGLRMRGDRANVPFLVGALEDARDDGIKLHAIRGLAEMRASESVAPLVAALDERSALVRMAAGDALADIGDNAAIPAVEAARRRTWNPFVRHSLRMALARLRAAA